MYEKLKYKVKFDTLYIINKVLNPLDEYNDKDADFKK